MYHGMEGRNNWLLYFCYLGCVLANGRWLSWLYICKCTNKEEINAQRKKFIRSSSSLVPLLL